MTTIKQGNFELHTLNEQEDLFMNKIGSIHYEISQLADSLIHNDSISHKQLNEYTEFVDKVCNDLKQSFESLLYHMFIETIIMKGDK